MKPTFRPASGRSLICAATALMMTACASVENDSAADASGSAQNQQLDEYRVALAEREAEIMRLREAAAAGSSSTVSSTSGSELFPPNAQPGHCYARVLIPAEFTSESETVLAREASYRYEVTAPVLETVQEQVLVREASSRLEIIPATYKEVSEEVLVKPASTKLVQIPAEYNTVTEQVLDKPAHTIWKRGAGPIDGALQTAIDDSTGEVMCLVKVPATYRTVSKTVLAKPASTQEIDVPAVYKTITRTVVDTPATTRSIEIPAEYKTVQSQKLVTAAQQRKIEIPAEYETLTKRKKVSEEKMAWREVLCRDNMTNDVVRTLQATLDQAGYLKSSVDGVLGPNTLRAANAYAKSKGLPVGKNYIALETAQDLGVNL